MFDAELKDALVGLTTRDGTYKYIAQATKEQLATQMKVLLNEHSGSASAFDKMASLLVQNLQHLSVSDIPTKYLQACAIAFSDHPILFINKCMQFQDMTGDNRDLRGVYQKRGIELMLSLHENRKKIKDKIRIFHTEERTPTLELMNFLPYLITMINFSLDSHPDKCKEILAEVLDGVDAQLNRLKAYASLSPQISSRLFQLLALFKYEHVKELKSYQSVMEKALSLSGTVDSRYLKPNGVGIVNGFSYHFYWFRLASSEMVDNRDAMYPMLVKHVEQLKLTAQTLMKMYPELFVPNNDEKADKMLSRYYHGITHLMHFGQALPRDLLRFLEIEIAHMSDRRSPIEEKLSPELRDEVNNLMKKHPTITCEFKTNAALYGFELDVMLTLTTVDQQKTVNIEIDSVKYHSEPLALKKNQARDRDLKAKNVEVIRLVVGDQDVIDYSDIIKCIESGLSTHTTHLRTTQWKAVPTTSTALNSTQSIGNQPK